MNEQFESLEAYVKDFLRTMDLNPTVETMQLVFLRGIYNGMISVNNISVVQMSIVNERIVILGKYLIIRTQKIKDSLLEKI